MEHSFSEFIYLRPVFITFLVVLLVLFIIILFQRSRGWVNLLTVTSIAAISTFVSAMILYIIGIIVDEHNLSGDPVSFFLFIAVAGLSIVNVLVFLVRNQQSSST